MAHGTMEGTVSIANPRGYSICTIEAETAYLYTQFGTPIPLPIGSRDEAVPQIHEPVHLLTSQRSPWDWSTGRKSFTLWTTTAATNFASFAASSYAPSKAKIAETWDVSEVAALVGITAFTTGFGLAPMFLAPISETWGRKPVFVVSGIIHAVCQVCCAVTPTFSGMIISRFLAGVGSSTYSTLVGGVIADIYSPKDRGTPMAIFSGSALFGTGLGPIVCGFIVQEWEWRWTFWLQAILSGLLLLLFVLFVPETRHSILLSERTRHLNDWYAKIEQNPTIWYELSSCYPCEPRRVRKIRWKSCDKERTESLLTRIAVSTYRPFQLLCTEPVVFFFSLWAAFSWSVLYLALAAVPIVFEDVYGFSLSMANAIFVSSCVASILAPLVSICQERWLDGQATFNLRLDRPERRLYFSCIESILLPIGLFMFGWTAQTSIPWIVPAISIGISTLGIFSIYQAVFNYLADIYNSYASSALAAQSFCRNVCGGVLPLVTSQMFSDLGHGPASSLLGGIGLLLTAVPWMLVIYNKRILSSSKFAAKMT